MTQNHKENAMLPMILRSSAVFWGVLIIGFALFLGQVAQILLPFVLGMLLAYLFDPLADRLERAKFSRTAATALITVLLFASIIGMLLWILPLLIKQFAGLVSALPDTFDHVDLMVRKSANSLLGVIPGVEMDTSATLFRETMYQVSQDLIGSPADLAKKVVASSGAILNVLSLLFITPIVSFYCLRDWDKMVAKVDSLLPRDYVQTVRTQIAAIDDTLAGFLRGQFNVMLILAVYYCIALSIASVPFAIVIGLLSAVFIIIPYVGTVLTMGLGLGIVWADSGLGVTMYATIGIFLVGQVMEQQFLTPKIVGEKVGLHPLWMLFAMLSGAALFGFVGVLLAVPIAAVIGVLVRFALSNYMQSPYYNGQNPPSA